jgi:methionyl-tRNA formyltransferase
MKISFFAGTPEFAVPALAAPFIAAGHDIAFGVHAARPPVPVGMKLRQPQSVGNAA